MKKIKFKDKRPLRAVPSYSSIGRALKTLSLIVLTSLVINNVYNSTYNYNKTIKENKAVTKIQDNSYNPANLVSANVVISTGKSGGSGSIIKVGDKTTYILTAAHVVSYKKLERDEKGKLKKKLVEARLITVIHKQGKSEALIVKINYKLDIALIKVFRKIDITPVKIAQEEPGLGETVWSISNPGNMKDIVNKGIFSGIDADQSIVSIAGFFGSSGGMVLNEEGEQIGVISTVLVARIGRHFPSLTVYNGITRTADLNEFLKGAFDND